MLTKSIYKDKIFRCCIQWCYSFFLSCSTCSCWGHYRLIVLQNQTQVGDYWYFENVMSTIKCKEKSDQSCSVTSLMWIWSLWTHFIVMWLWKKMEVSHSWHFFPVSHSENKLFTYLCHGSTSTSKIECICLASLPNESKLGFCGNGVIGITERLTHSSLRLRKQIEAILNVRGDIRDWRRQGRHPREEKNRRKTGLQMANGQKEYVWRSIINNVFASKASTFCHYNEFILCRNSYMFKFKKKK